MRLAAPDPDPAAARSDPAPAGRTPRTRPLPVREARDAGLLTFRAPRCGSASVLAWPDQVERPVDHPRSRFHVADLAGDPLIDAGAASDRLGKPGRLFREGPWASI